VTVCAESGLDVADRPLRGLAKDVRDHDDPAVVLLFGIPCFVAVADVV
jgi:hypothetical protein